MKLPVAGISCQPASSERLTGWHSLREVQLAMVAWSQAEDRVDLHFIDELNWRSIA